jgi:phage gp36-like protein
MYCTAVDLVTGDMLPPRGITVDKIIADASLEIDSVLGQRYVTPIVFSNRPSSIADANKLRLCCAHLASGRLILASAIGGEDVTLHGYGIYLVNHAMNMLTALVTGKIRLEDAVRLTDEQNQGKKGMLTNNGDAYSTIDDFYNNSLPQTVPGSRYRYLGETLNPYPRDWYRDDISIGRY